MINFNKKDSVASTVDSILKKEEVEQLDELKKSTLGSYVKSAARDASASRKLGADFQTAATKAKTDRTKASNTRLADKFNSIAQKRHAGIGKAVERLTKEDTEQVDEALKGNQHKIDKNHNNKIDAQDFKILRGKKSLKKFKEEHDENSIIDQMINEVLSKDASAGKWIHDFVHSDNPKFAGKSKAKRKEMALGAYYAKQRNEEVEQIDELKKSTLGSYIKKASKDTAVHGFAIGDSIANKKWSTGAKAGDMAAKRISGISKATDKLTKEDTVEEVEILDEGKMDKMTLSGLWHKHAQHSYWADQGYGSGSDSVKHAQHAATAIENHVRKHHGNKVADDMVSHSDHHVAHSEYAGPEDAPHHKTEMAKLKKKHGIRDENLNEGWDDMVKTAQEKVKSGPKPSGGSGVKLGTRYGGGKQKEEPKEKEEVKEGKQPLDNVPFDPPYNTTSSPDVKDKSGAVHTPMSRVKHIARTAMKKVKKELGNK
jgi:hypothetical protein